MKIFVTGIGTDVGKTVVSSIIVRALDSDYWKPIQAGDLDNSDSHKVDGLKLTVDSLKGEKLGSLKGRVFPNAYCLNTPASPHYAAELDGITIDISKIVAPETDNHLVVEGAGGILVPLNDNDCIIDIIKPEYKVIVVSRHYLGSINHTLMTLEILKSRNINVSGIIFSGNENKATESIILNKTGVNLIGRIDEEKEFNAETINKYADLFRANLLKL